MNPRARAVADQLSKLFILLIRVGGEIGTWENLMNVNCVNQNVILVLYPKLSDS